MITKFHIIDKENIKIIDFTPSTNIEIYLYKMIQITFFNLKSELLKNNSLSMDR